MDQELEAARQVFTHEYREDEGKTNDRRPQVVLRVDPEGESTDQTSSDPQRVPHVFSCPATWQGGRAFQRFPLSSGRWQERTDGKRGNP